jgi:ribosomal protein L7/L12
MKTEFSVEFLRKSLELARELAKGDHMAATSGTIRMIELYIDQCFPPVPPPKYEVMLDSSPCQKKINGIKIIRSYYNPVMGLKEAKDLYESAQIGTKVVLTTLDEAQAERMVRELCEIGASAYVVTVGGETPF